MTIPVTMDPTAWGGRIASRALDIGAIQDAIAAQLTGYFAAAPAPLPISVYSFPNFDLDTWWKSTSIAFALVRYRETQFGQPDATDSMVQDRTIEFSVHVEAKLSAWAITGTGSVYALIEAIEAALTGFSVPGCRHAYFTEETFDGQDAEGGVWLYDMRLKVPTRRPKQEATYALTKLASVLLVEAAGQTPQPQAPVQLTFAGGSIAFPVQNISSVALTDASNGRVYVLGTDYSVNGLLGTVAALAGGAIANGTIVNATYASADVVEAVSGGGRAPLVPHN